MKKSTREKFKKGVCIVLVVLMVFSVFSSVLTAVL